MVFQDIALFPHLTVLENIQFGIRSLSRNQQTDRSQELLKLIGMPQFKKKYPHQLSGGQQQRVALARAMASKPSLLLMDEPFSSLDEELRDQLAREVGSILKQENVSAILVTHDQNEAFAIGDEICVMHEGKIQQKGSAYNLYHNPLNRFVAEFIGEGSIFPGVVVSKNIIETDLGNIEGTLPDFCKMQDKVDVLIRPEDVVISESNEIQAIIKARYFRGSKFLYHLKTNGGKELYCLHSSSEKFQIDQQIGVRIKIKEPIIF
jgi:iron(III) transport system ATP-binding protein